MNTCSSPLFVTTHTDNILVHYSVKKCELGRGSCGIVRKCVHRETNEVYAVKTIKKDGILNLNCLRKEIAILRGLKHRNIISLKEIYEDERYIHLITPICTGKDLFSRILEKFDSKNGFTEHEIADIARKMLDAVAYCHARGVTHRDLKPENFVFESEKENSELKLIDFGLSTCMHAHQDKRSQMQTSVGTAYYIAPEVLKKSYTNKCDLWSIGVILYIMFCGYAPFDAEADHEIYNKILYSEVEFSMPDWENVSIEAKLFLLSLFERNPDLRPSAEQALAHPWLSSCCKRRLSFTFTKAEFMRIRLAEYLALNPLQKESLRLVVKELEEKDINHLKRFYDDLDSNKDGVITAEELKMVLRENGFEKEFAMMKLEVDELVIGLDLNGDRNIDFQEFLAAVVDRNLCNNDKNLQKVFKIFDVEDSGHISAKELVNVFQTLEDAQLAIDSFDTNKNGLLELEEFQKMMYSCFSLYSIIWN